MRNEIPYRKILRAVRFRPSEINQWIDNGGLNDGGDAGEKTETIRLEVQEVGGEII
jgi:hypothetical protein